MGLGIRETKKQSLLTLRSCELMKFKVIIIFEGCMSVCTCDLSVGAFIPQPWLWALSCAQASLASACLQKHFPGLIFTVTRNLERILRINRVVSETVLEWSSNRYFVILL